MSYGEGIEFVLSKISISPTDRQAFKADAQNIENAVIRAISRHDITFRNAFGGLSQGGSVLDDIKIDLPDEFDMHVKMNLPFEVEPVLVRGYPGYVFLKASKQALQHPCVERVGNDAYINRKLFQSWFRTNFTAIMPELQNIICDSGRCYCLKYTSHGYGVAHTVVATERSNRGRKIKFDFVPVFEFDHKQWPVEFPRRSHLDRTWYAVPRRFMAKNAVDDARSFFICAPHWERLMLKKKQNLKDSLRLMKAFRNANEMWQLKSYMIKSLYLTEIPIRAINWNQSPGRILIRMLVVLLYNLLWKTQPFFWATDHNNFETISGANLVEYKRIVSRTLHKLMRRRDADYLSKDDMRNFFGILY